MAIKPVSGVIEAQIINDNLSYLDSKTNNISKGSPAGTYSTLASLISAFPKGNTNLYVVASDGKWYFWSGTAWTAGGVYQGTGIADASVTSIKRTRVGEYSFITSSYPLDVRTADRTIVFPNSALWLTHGTTTVNLNPKYNTAVIDVAFGGKTDGWIVLDTVNLDIKTVYSGSATKIEENDIILGNIRWYAKPMIIFNAWFTVNGFAYTNKIASADMSPNYAFPWITSADAIEIIPDRKTIKFPNNAYIQMLVGNKAVNLSTKYRNVEIDCSFNGEKQGWLYYNTVTETMKTVYLNSPDTMDNYDIPLASIWWNTLKIDCNFKYRVGGYATGRDKFINQRLLFAGDSITAGGQDGTGTLPNVKTYGENVKEFLGFAEYTQDGVGGSSLAVRSGYTNSAVERCANWSGVHVLGIGFGMNDFTKGVPLGTPDSTDTSTFYGALNYVLPKVLENNYNAHVFYMTPPKNNKATSCPSFTPNSQGLLQKDYVNAILEKCDYYSIPVLDLYKDSGMSPFITANVTNYRPDRVHFNEIGYYRLARKIAAFIERL